MMGGDTFAFDTVLDLCRNQHRRIVLGMLTAEQQSLTVDDLMEAISEYNHHTPITEVSEDVLTEIRFSLHHQHLPKLASEGFVTYDAEREVVEPTEQLVRAESTLSTILTADPSLEAPIEL